TFSEDNFYFYENRTNFKDKFRTGIFKPSEDKTNLPSEQLFFKILSYNFSNKEKEISSNLTAGFDIVKSIFIGEFADKFIHFYPYIDAHGTDGYAFLHKSNIPLAEKKAKLEKYMDTLRYQIISTVQIGKSDDEKSESNKLFFDRIRDGGRGEKYYGIKYEKLTKDIKQTSPEFSNNFERLLDIVTNEATKPHKTIFAYTHGDFHDLNFSYDGLHWDTDTFGYNPITNDLAIYYWNFYAREDSHVWKYAPWLSMYMRNDLSPIELNEMRDVKKAAIADYYSLVTELFSLYGLSENFFEEFTMKLFCRAFLTDNVTQYSMSDRVKLYGYWNNYISIQDSNNFLTDALFPNNGNNIENMTASFDKILKNVA
ncbi:MAG: hypothetical protein LBE13_21730, partial [Bacteroidales bacterium]|nr:hypothetical protein [Bacteroidales bacterium]